ncbi:MAG: hypothetical protein NDJ72_13595 [Elusimicrobia bacterium]|nr:hypothetical protein [Elusimicrobiota bacterium]
MVDAGAARRIALYAGVLAAALAALLWNAPSDVPFHPDIVRELLIARNGLADPGASLGCPSSTVFFHGFAWDRFLIAMQQAGISVARLPVLIGALHAAGLLLFFRVVMKETDAWTGALAAAALGLASSAGLFDRIRHVTMVPPLVCLLLYALHRACAPGARRPYAWFALCGALFSLGTQWHLELFLFFPGLALVLLSLRPRAWAVPAFAALTLLPWLIVSRDSAAANWRLLLDAPWRTYGGEPSGPLLLRLAPMAAALAFLPLFWGERSPFRRSAFYRLIAGAAASYGVCLAVVFLFHFFDAQYLPPLLPPLILMAAKAVRPALRWSIPLLLLGYANAGVRRRAPDAVKAPLTLGEIERISAELGRRGLGHDEMYRLLSSGQALQSHFQSGMWLYAPCLRDERVIGDGGGTDRRVLAAAVPRGFAAPEGGTVLPGASRDLLLVPYEPWVDLSRFAAADGAARTLSFENPGHGQARCLDVNLPYAARGAARPRDGAALTFPVRVPASGESRVLHLPELAAQGQPMPGCAATIAGVEGVEAKVSPGARRLELRPTGRAQRGTVTVEWPVNDPRCFADGFVFYPMPMAEMTESLYARLGPFLD